MRQNGHAASEVTIAGAGLAGLALGLALAREGCEVVLLEQRPLEQLVEPEHDGRVIAVAAGTQRFLAHMGAWDGMVPEAEPIWDIVVGEHGSPVQVRYDHGLLGQEPLGWIVPNRVIRLALLAALEAQPSASIRAPLHIAALEERVAGLALQLSDGTGLTTQLLAVAEGRNAPTRDLAHIGMTATPYRQTGIVATLAHALPHRGLAIERFWPIGPHAMLPLPGTEAAPHRSSMVWALADEAAEAVRRLSPAAFSQEVSARFADRLGAMTLEGPRWYYPLQLVQAQRLTAPRLALVGDAARTIHPIAGQGWNLAMRDVASLAQIVTDRQRLGLDPGEAPALAHYARWRATDGAILATVTDGITRLFSNDLGPLQLARNAGLALVERVPAAKRLFMRHAMGDLGDLPRAMRR